jgi:hypothetical protein
MPPAPKRTFKTLPAGASGSSTNPETVARNRRRRKLDPLQAEYERARANRGNRISSKIKRLKKQAAYINASAIERISMEQAIRDTEESVYQADRAAIAQLHARMQPDVSVADVSVADVSVADASVADASVADASADAVAVAVAADSAQLACLTAELSIAGPARNAETTRSADREGGVAEGVFVLDQDDDEEMGEVDEDEDDQMSAGSEAFDGILYHYVEVDDDIDMCVDEEIDGENEEEDVEAGEEVEAISGKERCRRIDAKNERFLEMLEEIALADEAVRQKRRKRKGKEM